MLLKVLSEHSQETQHEFEENFKIPQNVLTVIALGRALRHHRNNFGVLGFPPGLPRLGSQLASYHAIRKILSQTFLPTRSASRKESLGA